MVLYTSPSKIHIPEHLPHCLGDSSLLSLTSDVPYLSGQAGRILYPSRASLQSKTLAQLCEQ